MNIFNIILSLLYIYTYNTPLKILIQKKKLFINMQNISLFINIL